MGFLDPTTLSASGEWAESTLTIHRWLKRAQDRERARYQLELAWLRLAQARHGHAVRAAEKAVHLSRKAFDSRRTRLEAHLVIGMAKLRAGDADAAVQHLKVACGNWSPRAQSGQRLPSKAHLELARALEAGGDHLGAVMNYARACSRILYDTERPVWWLEHIANEICLPMHHLGLEEGSRSVVQRAVSSAEWGIPQTDVPVISAVLFALAGDEASLNTMRRGLRTAASQDEENERSAKVAVSFSKSARDSKFIDELDARLQSVTESPLSAADLDLVRKAFAAAQDRLGTWDDLRKWIDPLETALDAAGLFRETDAIWEQALLWVDHFEGPSGRETARALSRVGSRLAWTGRPHASLRLLSRAAEIDEQRGGGFWLADDLFDIARAAMSMGRPGYALSVYTKARDLELEESDRARVLRRLPMLEARCFAKLGRREDAVRCFRQAISQYEERYPDDATWTIGPQLELASLLMELGETDEPNLIFESTAWADERLRTMRSTPGQSKKDQADEVVWQAVERANLATQLGLPAMAEHTTLLGLDVLIGTKGARCSQLIRPLVVLSEALAQQDRNSEARESLQRALAVSRRYHYDTHPQTRDILRRLKRPADGCRPTEHTTSTASALALQGVDLTPAELRAVASVLRELVFRSDPDSVAALRSFLLDDELTDAPAREHRLLQICGTLVRSGSWDLAERLFDLVLETGGGGEWAWMSVHHLLGRMSAAGEQDAARRLFEDLERKWG